MNRSSRAIKSIIIATTAPASHAGVLEQVFVPERLNEGDDLGRELLFGARHSGAQDFDLALERGEVDPVVQAAALQRVVHFAGPVRGQDDDRRLRGADRPDLGHRDLVVRQRLEQESLERLVGAIDLV